MKEGIVLSNKMKNTVTVGVTRSYHHSRYEKLVEGRKKYYAHTEEAIPMGSIVKIMETRPLSKLKRFRVVEVVEVAQEKIEAKE